MKFSRTVLLLSTGIFVLLALLAGELRGGEEKTASPGEPNAETTQAEPKPEPEPEGTIKIKQPETYLEYAEAGGPLMIPIALCSVLWLAFLVERLVATRRSRVLPPPLVQALKALPSKGNPDRSRAESILGAHPSTAASVLKVALRKIDEPRQELELAVNGIARREVRILRRYLRVFAVIASVTPLLGLLGTVFGMIEAFRTVTIVGLGAGQNLAPGIYVALITTASGLFVAIPSLITYFWLSSRVDSYVHEIDNLVMDFVDAQHAGGKA